ncbi:hypothetical protein K505DRAFT_239762 [Melanomma pulvis-pyrius CBS 109.77]|uniref:Dockerin type 1 n=1 Tax=Melanomma pulvis-pyrius CBS 109.77 TaxID=1314802 RepID=A0A6A6XG02_9PLEO|nr:hypothetical protein K505DRAFT_239762 [Melanomma pulvis-pyrius CBS 109.77]
MAFFKQTIIIAFCHTLVAATPFGTPVRAAIAPPASFTSNAKIGPGGITFTDSAHFRVYGATSSTANDTLNMLESAYSCFVDDLGWRSSGLGFNDDSDADGPWTKVNVYSVDALEGAAGVMHSDFDTGMAWLEVVKTYLTVPGVTVHEYGHGLTYHARTWVDQSRTGAWWETVAEWFADTYKTSSLCENGRSKFGQSTTLTEINLEKVIGDSFQVIVDGSVNSGNYYEAWPFLSYLTNNPDNFTGLGSNTIRESFAQYSKGSNETPLHAFARLSTSNSIQRVVGRYWARMAFVDIGHPTAQSVFLERRKALNYANLDSQSNSIYKVKAARQPRYMGANIIPLTKSGTAVVTAKITTGGTCTATLSVRNTSNGTTRYIDFANGSASTSITASEEAAIVVANTPSLIQYDPFSLTSDVNTGLDYTLTLSGATA